MRKVTLIQLFMASLFLWMILSVNEVIPDGYRTFVFLGLVMSFSATMDLKYFSEQPLGYANWVNPILKLMALQMRLDGTSGHNEHKRIKKYLNNEFDPFTANLKYEYFKKVASKKLIFSEIITQINENSGSIERMRVVNQLIKLAIVDRLITDKEMIFITKASKRLGIHKRTLENILRLQNYITEEDVKNQQYARPVISSSTQKAYEILGLESNASMEEVKDSYRSLAKLFHPDKQGKNANNPELAKQRFQAISDAYQILKDKLN